MTWAGGKRSAKNQADGKGYDAICDTSIYAPPKLLQFF
jgi:hypothetical protein